MNRKTMTFAAATAFLALLTACGGGSNTGTAAQASDHSAANAEQRIEATSPSEERKQAATHNVKTCDLVTTAQVTQILGREMQQGVNNLDKSQNNVTLNQCTWLSASTRDQAIASLFVRKSSEKDASRAFDQNREANPDAVAVDGIDARAYYVPSMGQLNVLDDDAWFIITANKDGLSGEPEVTQQHRQLAALVVKAY